MSSAVIDRTTELSSQPLDVSVIVPTYCESENLPILVPQVAAELKKAGLRGEIIIVDDNSPDDTEQVCAQLSADYAVRLEVRKTDRGLSSAVIHGMRQAEGAVFVVMDADLSHPPEKVPELVAALKSEKCDFVIGSRYVKGGGTDDDWGLFRWLNSKFATWMAWPLTSANDPMAGFFAIRSATLDAAEDLNPIGYKIGLELMVKCGCRQVNEVPIQFRDRLHGESKLSLREQINYLWHLKRLYEFKLGHLARSAQFLVVGATGMGVDFLVFSLLLLLFPLGLARALAIWCAMTWNFYLNRRITFSDAAKQPILRQYVLFCLSCLAGALVNWSVSVGLCMTLDFFHQYSLLAAFLGVVAGTGFNYVLSCCFVFRRPVDANAA